MGNNVQVSLGVSSLAIIGLAVFMEYNNVCRKMCGEEEESSTTTNGFRGNRFTRKQYYDGPQEDDALLRKSKRSLNF